MHRAGPWARAAAPLIAVLLLGSFGGALGGPPPPSLDRPVPSAGAPGPGGSPLYVNFSDAANAWTNYFYTVAWPSGPFAHIQVVSTLRNYGDGYDRENWAMVDNVTVLEYTTLENDSNDNPVQTYVANITEYGSLFAAPGTVWWESMPNSISPCDSSAHGCWSGVLSFQFLRGSPPSALPQIVPIFPFSRIDTTTVYLDGTVALGGDYARAEAVVNSEALDDDEFWYGTSNASREIRLVLAGEVMATALPLPLINSGGEIGSGSNLEEWNGTPPPGTGVRPPTVLDVTPWTSLLNGTVPYNFTIVRHLTYWYVSAALFLWGGGRAGSYAETSKSLTETLTLTSALLRATSVGERTPPYATETYATSTVAWFNASSSSWSVVTFEVSTDSLVTATVSVVTTQLDKTWFNLSVDGTGAVHLAYDAVYDNTSVSTGNGQAADRLSAARTAWDIAGANGGTSSTEVRAATEQASGRSQATGEAFSGGAYLYLNRTQSGGVGGPVARSARGWGQPAMPFAGRLVVTPSVGAVYPVSDSTIVTVELVSVDPFATSSTLTVAGQSYNVTGTIAFNWSLAGVAAGTYAINVSSTDAGATSTSALTVFVGSGPPTLSVTMQASPLSGPPPLLVTFSSSVAGGVPAYGWSWNFGDGSAAVPFRDPSHTYASAGEYTVNLTVTDATGSARSQEATIVVSLSFYALTFDEAGLPNGTAWSMSLAGVGASATAPSPITWSEPNGSYAYTIGPVSGYSVSPSSGSATVSGSATSVVIGFTPLPPPKYPIELVESGLPDGTTWSATLAGSTRSSSNSTIDYALPNGTYGFVVPSAAGRSPTPASGYLNVAGLPVVQPIDFAAPPPTDYAVAFVESGLPSGQAWTVTLGDASVTSSSSTIAFNEPNGSYPFRVGPVPGFATNWTGTVRVSGAAVERPVGFAPFRFDVIFSETGLPAGARWNVTLESGGLIVAENSTQGSSLLFGLVNGTYTYAAGGPSGYRAVPSGATFLVKGVSVETIAFSPNPSAASSLGLPLLLGIGAAVAAVAIAAIVVVVRRGSRPER